MSLFGDALGAIVDEIHRAEGAPTITYEPTVGAPFALVAVWDSVGVVLDLETGAFQRTNEPRLGVVLSDFAVPPIAGDGVTVAGVAYRVTDVALDGQGGAELKIRRA